MLEPRRLAARRSAEYMASLLGEPVGNTIGYRIRGETRTSNTTRVEVVTEGVLTRMLLDQPDLPDIALVIFDEFHERSIHADLGLALCLEVQAHLRNDLHILVMSATLDEKKVSEFLGGAPFVQSKGRSFPVETRYLSFPYDGPVEKKVVEVIRRAIHEGEGDILVFLPGQREIRRVERLLSEKEVPDGISICILHGEATNESQRLALSPAMRGQRKVILSTSIAETSLTIDGVRIVVDGGLARSARFDPRRGMSGLVTLPVSKAADASLSLPQRLDEKSFQEMPGPQVFQFVGRWLDDFVAADQEPAPRRHIEFEVATGGHHVEGGVADHGIEPDDADIGRLAEHHEPANVFVLGNLAFLRSAQRGGHVDSRGEVVYGLVLFDDLLLQFRAAGEEQGLRSLAAGSGDQPPLHQARAEPPAGQAQN